MPKLSHSIFLLFAFFLVNSLFGQAGHYWNENQLNSSIEELIMQNHQRSHFSVKPYSLRDIPIEAWQRDTSRVLRNMGRGIWAEPDSNKWAFDITPLLQMELGYANKGGFVYKTAPGLALHARYGKKLSLYADFLGGAIQGPDYVQAFIDETGVVPSLGKNRANAGVPAFGLPTARLAYAPSNYFQFELGYGKNTFGQGYRSLFLSDWANNYPFLKIETDVWHIKYVNLLVQMDGTNPIGPQAGVFQKKYAATHYLSWAISPRFNLGLFETIVWQGKDSLSNRGFDPNYLNPIIFYRSVEYSVGSADNAMLGFDLSYKASKNTLIYGQLLLDEFLLDELKSRSGWWANKWGTQIGVKAHNAFGQDGLRLQAEVNIARPFTYSHGSVLQNYGHYNQALAHQFGTNFYEGLLRGYYEFDDYYAEASLVYGLYGRDPDSLNYGGDIYRSYENPSKEFGNTIAQGVQTRLYFQKLSGGIILNRDLNLRLGLDYLLRVQNTQGQSSDITHMLGLHLVTRISNTYRDF